MTNKSIWLLDFQSNVFSQAGEDGIIEKILGLLPERDQWCVEFGAWDGIYYSNTRNLIENSNYSAVLIEGDRKKFDELKKNYSQYPAVITFNRFVGFDKRNCLDTILATSPIPENFDFLSIDIDGNDYHIWKVTKKYKPKIVCLEFNPTIPTEVNFIQPADPRVNQGSSLSALAKLGKEKGYELVSVLPFNAIFVRAEYFPLFQINDNEPETLRVHNDVITYMFMGYDGTIFLRGHRKLNWHGIELNEAKFQILPRFLRKYPLNYNKIEKMIFNLLFGKRDKS